MNERDDMADALNEGARSGMSGGTHAYGYEVNWATGAAVEGECYRSTAEVCIGVTTTQCHSRFICVPCLQLHVRDLERDGVSVEHKGVLNPLKVEIIDSEEPNWDGS